MTEKKLPIKERNAKFIEYYEKVQKSDNWKDIRIHKRIKYLQSGFYTETKILMPLGTIYKLLKPNPEPSDSKAATE